METVNLKMILLMVIIPFIFVTIVTPFVMKLANHVGALDIPDKRKVHKKPMPRLGGLGIYAGFLLGYILFGETTYMMNAILIGSFIIVLTGIVDDIKPIDAKYKLIGQFIAALIVVVYGRLLIQDVNIFGVYIDFGWLSYPITILFMLGCINCLNLIDGLDGLAGGVSAIFFLSIGILAYLQSKNGLYFGLAYALTFIMFGSTSGFLVHNFNPAKIFMGDSGSMFLGFIISIITLLGFKSVMVSSIVVPLFILVVPILDTLFAIIRRKLKGESFSTPDKSHIHHQLLRKDFSQKTTVLIIYLITSLFSAASIIYIIYSRAIGMISYALLMMIFVVLVLKTDILFEHKKESRK